MAGSEVDLEPVQANNTLSTAVRMGLRMRPTPFLELSITPELAHWRSFAWAAQQPLWDEWFVEPGDPPLPPMLGRHRPSFRPVASGALLRVAMEWVDVDRPMLPTRGGDLRLDACLWGLQAPTDRRVETSASLHPPWFERWVCATHGSRLLFVDPIVPSVPGRVLSGGGNLRGARGASQPSRLGLMSTTTGSGQCSLHLLRFAVWPRLHVFGFPMPGAPGKGWWTGGSADGAVAS